MNTSFVNPVVAVVDTPRLDEASFEPVAPAYMWAAWLLTGAWALAGIGILTALVLVGVLDGWLVGVAFGVVVAGALCVGLLERSEFRRMGYLVREHDVSFRSGLVRIYVETIPFSRVQSVSLERKVLDRVLGLSELKIQTAGGQLSVVGLSDGEAVAVKAMIVDRAYLAAEAEQPAPME